MIIWWSMHIDNDNPRPLHQVSMSRALPSGRTVSPSLAEPAMLGALADFRGVLAPREPACNSRGPMAVLIQGFFLYRKTHGFAIPTTYEI